MKRFLIISAILLACANTVVSAQEQYTYTPAYIRHLKVCNKYTDEYITNIPTGDQNSPYLKVKSTEEILGYLNSKCYTRSEIYSYDLDKVIMTIKCGMTRNQVAEAVKKMHQVNMEQSEEARRALQKELTKMIEDKETCKVNNYLDDKN